MKCISLYKSPSLFYSLWYLFFCYSFDILGEDFVFPSTIHLPHCLFVFCFLFQSDYMYRKTQTSHLCCPAVQMISLRAVNTAKFKPQTEPSLKGRGHNVMEQGIPRQSGREDSFINYNRSIQAFVDQSSSCCRAASLRV